jgi:hypothetical protein
MTEITRQLAYGDQIKTLRLYMAPGAGGSWYVSIDNYHYGQVIWQQDKWIAHLHEELELADIAIIEEMITEVMPNGPYG